MQRTCGKMQGWTQRESCAFGKFKSFIRELFSGSFSSFWQIILLGPPWLICLKTLPLGVHSPLSQDGSQRKGVWGKQNSLWPGVVPWLLTPKEPFCVCVVPPLPQGDGEWRSLDPLLKQDFAPLCSCHDGYLTASTRDKAWLFTLSLSLIPFRRANRRLILTWSPPISCLRKGKQEASCKWPAWSTLFPPQWNVNRRPVVNV